MDERVCRLCAKENLNFRLIFPESIENTNEIVEKILFISSIQILRDDGMPDVICDLCFDKLEELYVFKQQIILANETFLQNTSDDKLSIKSESVDWVKLEDEDDTFDVVNNHYEIHEEDIPLTDLLQVAPVVVQNENCDKITKRKYVRKKKVLEKQKLNQVKTIVCAECGKVLKRSSYSDHLQTQHNKEPQFECDVCGAKIKTKRLLWHHKKDKHEQRDKVSCDKCGLIFSTRNTFYRHYKALHLGLKKHACNLCEKTFARPKALHNHMRTHTGERPFMCSFCNRGFSGSWALKQHTFLHTNHKPYKCQLCPEAFTQNVTLKLHVKRKHVGITCRKEKDLMPHNNLPTQSI